MNETGHIKRNGEEKKGNSCFYLNYLGDTLFC